jgi:3-oxoacyl-[acyl-carrier-protein] synthase II
MNQRVAVTGIGAVTSIGATAGELWNGLVSGLSGIRRITRFDTTGLKTTIAGMVDVDCEDGRCVTRTTRMAELALEEALGAARLPTDSEIEAPLCVGTTGFEFEWSDRHAQVRATKAQGGPHAFRSQYRDDAHKLYGRDGVLVQRLQSRFGIIGPGTGVTTACASGGSAIELAVKAIRRGHTSVAVAGASDGNVSAETIVRFSLLSALSRANEVPERASRPFSRSRDGFVMAEGAAFLVLEDESHARQRGASILAFVAGVGSNADAFHRTRSRPDGSGGTKCMQAALRDGCIQPEQVDYVNAHGTSTPENDRMETLVLKRVFGEHASKLLISSNKSMLGHTLAAAGAVEAVATVLTIGHGVVPPTINYDDPDEELDLNYVPNTAVRKDIQFAVSNSFGFGGQNVTVLFQRADS